MENTFKQPLFVVGLSLFAVGLNTSMPVFVNLGVSSWYRLVAKIEGLRRATWTCYLSRAWVGVYTLSGGHLPRLLAHWRRRYGFL